MFSRCESCENKFFECDLRSGRCIDCWVKRCELWQRGATKAESEIEAFGRGYMQTQSLIEQCVGEPVNLSLLRNPYDPQRVPELYGQWLKGVDSRIGAYQRFLREREVAHA